jgi:nanoRNase/pAp phosphatase (c-di-AMP/oligoRNAs hydrolase)
MKKSISKLDQLKQVLENHTTLLIVLQDNPDPDSIASAVALRKLANTLSNVQCSIAHGGTVGRAENRALVNYLGVNLRDIRQLDLTQYELFAMVDTQPGTGNNSLPETFETDIVIDHHSCRRLTRQSRFTDIRSRYGATASILFEYLEAAQIKPEVPLATALLYAIRSDTQDLGRDAGQADIRALTSLYAYANTKMLSNIQRGKVQRAYYQMLANAMKNAEVVDNAIVCYLGVIENPDMIAEVADLLLRDDLTNWVMVCGVSAEKFMISLRTSQDQLSAERVVHQLVARKGTGGGHPSYAGGQIAVEEGNKSSAEAIFRRVRSRFVKSVTTKPDESQPLIQ